MSERSKSAAGRALAVYQYEGSHEDFEPKERQRRPSGPTTAELDARLVDRETWRRESERCAREGRILQQPDGGSFLARLRPTKFGVAGEPARECEIESTETVEGQP